MWQEILRAIPVYFSTMFKFILGPIGGYAARLNIITTIIATTTGSMTVVLLFAFFGNFIRTQIIHRFFKRKKLFTVRNRKFVTIWKKYGLVGIAVLTPCLLTPIGGSILAVSFGAPRNKMILFMLITSTFWAILFSVLIYEFGARVLPDYIK
jgi:hypothetical protein